MPTARRLGLLAATCLATLALAASGPEPDDDRTARLKAMPVEERVRLAGKLKEFLALPGDEQAAVRALDRALAAEPEENRAVYHAVLHRYHLWFRTLSDAQKSELAALAPDARLALVTKILADQRSATRAEPPLVKVANLGGIAPYDLAAVIKVWLKLTPQEQASVAKAPDPDQRRQAILALARQHRFEAVKRPSREEVEAAAEKVAPSPLRPVLKKAEEKLRRRVGEYSYLSQHPPRKVAPEKLYQFNRALPSWLRAGIEDVPPEEARWLLTNLYRLVFPFPEELEPPKPAAAAAKGARPAPNAPAPPHVPKAAPAPSAPRPSAPAGPF